MVSAPLGESASPTPGHIEPPLALKFARGFAVCLMYNFQDLSSDPVHTFCYLIGVLKKWPSEKQLSASFFTSHFEWLINVEDQSDTAWKTKRRCDLTRKYVLPTAPLTMTPSWSPFPLACNVLPDLLSNGRSDDPWSSAYAIFNPVLKNGKSMTIQFGGKPTTFELPVCDAEVEFDNIHAHHFFWLLEMTVSRAQQLKKPIVIAGLPGFGYQDVLDQDLIGEARLRLLNSGYLYPSRVPQGARFTFLSDPVARAERKAELERMECATPVFPPVSGL